MSDKTNPFIEKLKHFNIFNMLDFINHGIAIHYDNVSGKIFIFKEITNQQTAEKAFVVWDEIFHYESQNIADSVKHLMSNNYNREMNAVSSAIIFRGNVQILKYYNLIEYDARKDEIKVVGISGLYADYDSPIVNLSWFGLLPEYHGTGLGAKLLEITEAVAILLGYNFIQIESYNIIEQERAQRFYIKHGYEMFDIEEVSAEEEEGFGYCYLKYHFDKQLSAD